MRVVTAHDAYDIHLAPDGVWEMRISRKTEDGSWRFQWTRMCVNLADPFRIPDQLASFVDYEE